MLTVASLKPKTKELKGALLAGEFENAKAIIQTVNSNSVPIPTGEWNDKDELAVLSFRSMAAEIFEYWGDFQLATDFIECCSTRLLSQLAEILWVKQPPTPTDSQRLLLRQKVWVLIHSGTLSYRGNKLTHALHCFKICEEICEKFLITSTDKAYGTRARVQYCIGLVLREQLDFSNALTRFAESIKLAYLSLENRSTKISQLTYLELAKSLGLGLAFIHNICGRPDLAIPLLVAAKSLLIHLSEPIISSYIELIYANVLRGSESDSPSQMDEAIERLKTCYLTFTNHGHRLYSARSAYSLAVAHLQRARPDESMPMSEVGIADLRTADSYCDNLRNYAREDVRFFHYDLVLRSRIARKRDLLDNAELLATRAIEETMLKDSIHIDALISRGETRARKNHFDGARNDFETVLQLTENQRLRALCLLNLTRVHSRAGDSASAAKRLIDFEQIKGSVNNAQIRLLEAKAFYEFQQCNQRFVLRIEDPELDVINCERRLREFFINWAKARKSSDSDAARLLGVSRQTFYNWLDERNNVQRRQPKMRRAAGV